MSIEGGLRIALRLRDGAVAGVEIESDRPLAASRLFSGRKPEEVLRLLPRLYAVCGTAQAAAAAGALESALEIVPSAGVDVARSFLVGIETAREHLLRILLGWPAFLEESPGAAGLPALNSLVPEAAAALFPRGSAFDLHTDAGPNRAALERLLGQLEAALEAAVFGCPPAAWLERTDAAGLARWAGEGETVAARFLASVRAVGWDGIGASAVAPLPWLDDLLLDRRLAAADADAFVAAPEWAGAPAETTPLARQASRPLVAELAAVHGNGLLPRLAARLVELASLPGELRKLLDGAGRGGKTRETAGSGVGLAQVEASRGRLVHRVEVAGGTVRRYRIVAPTEWNFHPRGVVAQGLAGLAVEDGEALRRQAALLVEAVDPCVGYDLRLSPV